MKDKERDEDVCHHIWHTWSLPLEIKGHVWRCFILLFFVYARASSKWSVTVTWQVVFMSGTFKSRSLSVDPKTPFGLSWWHQVSHRVLWVLLWGYVGLATGFHLFHSLLCLDHRVPSSWFKLQQVEFSHRSFGCWRLSPHQQMFPSCRLTAHWDVDFNDHTVHNLVHYGPSDGRWAVHVITGKHEETCSRRRQTCWSRLSLVVISSLVSSPDRSYSGDVAIAVALFLYAFVLNVSVYMF